MQFNLRSVLVSFDFMIFIKGKYSTQSNVDLQAALLQKKSYKITITVSEINSINS